MLWEFFDFFHTLSVVFALLIKRKSWLPRRTVERNVTKWEKRWLVFCLHLKCKRKYQSPSTQSCLWYIYFYINFQWFTIDELVGLMLHHVCCDIKLLSYVWICSLFIWTIIRCRNTCSEKRKNKNAWVIGIIGSIWLQ